MTTPTVPTVTDELIADLETAARAATPGPWNYDGSYVCTMRKEDGTTYVESWNPVADALLTKNVHYIAAANPATILALLAERADLKQQLAAAAITAENCELFRKDAERLDWLISEDDCVVQQGTNGFWLQWIDEYDHSASEYQKGSYRTSREAIDAAMIDAARSASDGS